nr:retrovirus-related Pol polyprotein from transposon TNT 1-94 [Tanacetum cinerariifolium]
MVDYSLWKVIENNAPLITKVVERVETVIAPSTTEEKSQRSTRSTNGVVNTAHGVSTASSQVNTVNSSNIDNLSDAVIFVFLASQPSSPQLVNKDLEQIYPDDFEEMDLKWQMVMLTMRARRGHFARECKALRYQDNKQKESTRMNVPVETPASTTLVSCDGLESVEERLLVYKKNKFVYDEDIKLLKREIYLREVAITELRRKLELAQKEKDEIQLTETLCHQNLIFSGLEEFVTEPIVSEPTVKKPVVENSDDKASVTILRIIKNRVDHKIKVIRCDNETEFKNSEMNQFCEMKEAVNTACYVQNRVLVVKPHYKTPYELFHGRISALSFMRPFGCHVTILNTKDYLGKFDGKADKGFFVGHSLNSKAFKVFNSRTRIVEENLHIRFSENTPNIARSGPN